MSEITIKNLRAESRRIGEEIKRLTRQQTAIDRLVETLTESLPESSAPALSKKRVTEIQRRPTGLLILHLFDKEETGACFTPAMIRERIGYADTERDQILVEKSLGNLIKKGKLFINHLGLYEFKI